MERNARQAILEATYDLISEKGYFGTTVNEIIKKSNTSKGSLYYHFPHGKEDAVIALLDTFKEGMANRNNRMIDADAATAAICNQIDFIATSFDNFPAFHEGTFANLAIIAVEASRESPRIRDACLTVFESLRDAYIQVLMKHEICDEDKAHDLSLIIQQSIGGALVESYARGNAELLLSVKATIPALIDSYGKCS